MQIYPAIDIKDGNCVRLYQGKLDSPTVFGNDPAKQARLWESLGATYIHVVDLDGAKRGAAYNNEAIAKIVAAVNVPVQVGGGIRSLTDAQEKFEMGIARVILGTNALKEPSLIAQLVERYGEKIAVGVDAHNGFVAVNAWEEVSQVRAVELCLKMKSIGVTTIIYTDISKDGMLSGPNIEATAEIINSTGLNIIASGGVTSMEDLYAVEGIGSGGAIIGRALYEHRLDLSQVIKTFENRA